MKVFYLAQVNFGCVVYADNKNDAFEKLKCQRKELLETLGLIEQRNHQSLNGGSHMKPYIIPNDDRDYTDTIKFQKKKQKWKESGMSEKDIEKLTNLYHNFDVWGNDKGCNYSNTVIAYDVSELGYENCIR